MRKGAPHECKRTANSKTARCTSQYWTKEKKEGCSTGNGWLLSLRRACVDTSRERLPPLGCPLESPHARACVPLCRGCVGTDHGEARPFKSTSSRIHTSAETTERAPFRQGAQKVPHEVEQRMMMRIQIPEVCDGGEGSMPAREEARWETSECKSIHKTRGRAVRGGCGGAPSPNIHRQSLAIPVRR